MLDDLHSVVDVQQMDMGLRRRLERAATEAKKQRTIKPHITERPAGKYDPVGEPEGEITRPDEFHPDYHSSTTILCKDIADLLTKTYPGWAWAVQPQEFGQVINVYCLNLHNMYGYTIRMVDIMDDPRRKEAVRAGGEILRRFRMPNRFDAAALDAAPRDMNGNCIPDISDFATRKQQREAEIARKLDSGEWMIVEADGQRYLRAKK